MKDKYIHLIITRQNDPNSTSYIEEFKVPYQSNMNVISALMEIQKKSVNIEGKKTNQVVWEMNCLEEVCGACSMVINGKARQACSTLIDHLEQPIHLEPMSTFPVIRDLMVDRSQMFEALKKVKAWIPIDGTYELGPGPRMAERKRESAYELSKCMTCGVCLEVCPNVNNKTNFFGPALISQVRLFNAHPTGEMNKEERLDALKGNDGSAGCGNSQNCVRACPKGIPLTTSIADINRQLSIYTLKKFFTD